MLKIRLAEILGEKKWSRNDLSKITGIRYNTINDIFYEIAISIKFEHIEKICEALECTPGELFEYIPPKKKEKP